jgi:hypothetical protein
MTKCSLKKLLKNKKMRPNLKTFLKLPFFFGGGDFVNKVFSHFHKKSSIFLYTNLTCFKKKIHHFYRFFEKMLIWGRNRLKQNKIPFLKYSYNSFANAKKLYDVYKKHWKSLYPSVHYTVLDVLTEVFLSSST